MSAQLPTTRVSRVLDAQLHDAVGHLLHGGVVEHQRRWKPRQSMVDHGNGHEKDSFYCIGELPNFCSDCLMKNNMLIHVERFCIVFAKLSLSAF